jgi:hypothetical protein
MKKTGARLSEAARVRAQAAQRAAAIKALGMKPEPAPTQRGEEYAATTGELISWARERGLKVPEWTEYLSPKEREIYFGWWKR